MNRKELENVLKKSAPQTEKEVSERLWQKILNIYRQNFRSGATSRRSHRFPYHEIFYFFSQLSSMKKFFIASFATFTLLSLLIFSIFFGLHHVPHQGGLTLETLIAKAQSAAEQKASKGRYLHLKGISKNNEDFEHNSNEFNPAHSESGETWIDTQTNDYIAINRPSIKTLSDHNGTNFSVEIAQDKRDFVYNSYQHQLRESSSENDKKNMVRLFTELGPTMKSFIEHRTDSGALLPYILLAFPFSKEELIHDFSIKYRGQSQQQDKKLEGLTLSGSYFANEVNLGEPNKKLNYYMNFYFDAQTFDLVKIESYYEEMIKGHFLKDRWEMDILSSEYSDQVPHVSLDGVDFYLSDKAPMAVENERKTYKDSELSFSYPKDHFLLKRIYSLDFAPFDKAEIFLATGGPKRDRDLALVITDENPSNNLMKLVQSILQFESDEIIYNVKNENPMGLPTADGLKKAQTVVINGREFKKFRFGSGSTSGYAYTWVYQGKRYQFLANSADSGILEEMVKSFVKS